nr:MAG TPA: hypothetical protein [Caudoviricetes sp.]
MGNSIVGYFLILPAFSPRLNTKIHVKQIGI